MIFIHHFLIPAMQLGCKFHNILTGKGILYTVLVIDTFGALFVLGMLKSIH